MESSYQRCDDAEQPTDCWIFFDPTTASLETRLPEVALPPGRPVRWRFRGRAADGSATPLPAGWLPMLAFDHSDLSTTSALGPFASLLHVAATDADGGVSIDVLGEWPETIAPGLTPPTYFAGLLRGVGFGGDKGMSALTTRRLTLFLGPDREPVPTPPPACGKHRVDLTVRHDPERPSRLTIEPDEPMRIFTDSVVSWHFATDLPLLYPMILFYHFEDWQEEAGAVQFDGDRPNRYYEPCRRMRITSNRIDAWDFKPDRRHCFYEAAVLTSGQLSVGFLSTGDPQLDNEGTPFPTDEP
ncbi:MAG: hypothetical protein AAGD38_10190 [Acidobacteriota bacterium]